MLISSMGFVTAFTLSLPLPNASAREMGPTLPKYIVVMIMILPKTSRLAVRFLESPTVAVALTVSYKMSQSDTLHTTLKSTDEIKAIENEQKVTAMAFFKDLSDILLSNNEVCRRPVTEENAAATITTKVTVFIPPAVPTGEPPINMRTRLVSTEGSVNECCDTVANPAVLVVIDWKRLA